MKPEVPHLPLWSVFIPALFPTAASQLLSFMLGYSGARGQVQGQSPGPGVPEAEAGDRVEAASWHWGHSLPGVRWEEVNP